MKVIVRDALESEALKMNELLSKLINYEALKYDPNTNPEIKIVDFFEKRINKADNVVLVAEVKDEIVGFLYAASNMNGIKLHLETKINFLYVESDYRHMGVGSKLLDTYLKRAKEKGVKYVAINHYVDNIESENLYKKYGFKELTIDRRVEL